MAESIGFVGLGVMGRPMAKNLLKAGFSVVVSSRTQASVDELVAAGAVAATSPADVATRARIVITMVPDTADVQQVIAGTGGVLEGLQPDSIIIDMSSISPEATVRLAQALRVPVIASGRVLEVDGERMLTGNYKPGFRAKLYQKDLRLVNEAATANAVAMPATAIVTQMINALVAAGDGDLDYAAMGTVLFKLAGVE